MAIKKNEKKCIVDYYCFQKRILLINKIYIQKNSLIEKKHAF